MFYWLTLDRSHCQWSFSTRESCLILNWNHSLRSFSAGQITLGSAPLFSFSHHLLSLAFKICYTNLFLGFPFFLLCCLGKHLYSRNSLSRLISLRIFFCFVLVLWSDWCSWHIRIITIKSSSPLFSSTSTSGLRDALKLLSRIIFLAIFFWFFTITIFSPSWNRAAWGRFAHFQSVVNFSRCWLTLFETVRTIPTILLVYKVFTW